MNFGNIGNVFSVSAEANGDRNARYKNINFVVLSARVPWGNVNNWRSDSLLFITFHFPYP